MPPQGKSAYEILNVRKGASEEEIKMAYINMIKRYDPEQHTEQFMKIKAAYDRLRDIIRRAAEDVFTFDPLYGDFLFLPEDKELENDRNLNLKVSQLEERVNESSSDENARKELIHLYINRSWVKFRKKLWLEAIQDWQKLLAIEPTHLRARHNLINALVSLGFSYASHGLYPEAIDVWERSLKLNPDNPPLLHNLALAHEFSGEKEKSRVYWAELVQNWKEQLGREPDNDYIKQLIIEVHKHHGGEALTIRKDPETAIKEYEEILKIKPDDYEARFQIAASLLEEKQWEEASEQLHQLARENPKNVDVLNLLGWAYLNAGKVDEAFTCWRRVLSVDRKNAQALDNIVRANYALAERLRENKLYTKAIVHYKALLKYKPRDPQIHYEIGQLYMLKGDYDSAYREFITVLNLDPRNAMARRALSELKLKR